MFHSKYIAHENWNHLYLERTDDMEVFNNSILIVNAKELTVNARYKMNKLIKIPTKYGITVAADIIFENHHRLLFLPSHITNRLTDDAIQDINAGSFDLIYEGPIGRTYKFALVPNVAA